MCLILRRGSHQGTARLPLISLLRKLVYSLAEAFLFLVEERAAAFPYLSSRGKAAQTCPSLDLEHMLY